MGIIRAYLLACGQRKSIEDQIRDCATRYTAQTGQAPNLCFVHPDLIKGEPTVIDGIKVIPATGLLNFDCWLTFEDPTQLIQPNLL